MEARIVGSEAELGDVKNGLDFYGQHLTREWSEVTFSPDAFKKAQTNKFIEVRGEGEKGLTDPEAAKAEKLEGDQAATVKRRLDELGVSYRANASPDSLKASLDRAEKAKAKADEEAAAAEVVEDEPVPGEDPAGRHASEM